MSGVVPVVVVHGGAGAVPLADRPVRADACRRAAEEALAVLLRTGSSSEAVVHAVEVLENDARFNAGTGACLTSAGTLELDASVMEGTNLTLGAVACLPPFRNPIRIAEAVRVDGRHTCYAGEGAAAFAIRAGFTPADPEVMITPSARRRLDEVMGGQSDAAWAGGSTVGAVACDAQGRVAAATSTGGTVGKLPGRIGDTPLAGAGTWADDRAGACSATGVGEHIMRYDLAKVACDLIRAGVPAPQAADAAIAGFGARIEGRGGIIVVGPRGDAGLARNTETMSWAIARDGEATQFGS